MKKLIILYLIIVIVSYFYYNDTREITISGGEVLVEEPREPFANYPSDEAIAPSPADTAPERCVWEAEFTVSAYNTVPNQTDSSPCITASGENICGKIHTVACSRFFPFGTEFAIDNEVYRCNDRFHPKYDDIHSEYFDSYKLDINFDKDVAGAIKWGVRKKIVKIIEIIE